MSATQESLYISQFQAEVKMLAQQSESRLLRTVMRKDKRPGEEILFNRIAATAVQTRAGRFADLNYIEPAFSVRRVNYATVDHPTLVSRLDDMRMLVDADSQHRRVGAAAMGRHYDDVIIAAISGAALTGKSGTTTVALPDAQKVAVGGARLTLAKLKTVRKKFLAADISDSDMDKVTLVISAEQDSDLFGMTEATSKDYTRDFSIQDGRIDRIMGFKVVHSQRLATDSSGNRLVLAYTPSAVGVSFLEDMYASVDTLPQKANDRQILLSSTLGAVRVEEEQVVEVACSEA